MNNNDTLSIILQQHITLICDMNRIELVCKRWLSISRQRLIIDAEHDRQKIKTARMMLYPRLKICMPYIDAPFTILPTIFNQEGEMHLFAESYHQMKLLYQQTLSFPKMKFAIYVQGVESSASKKGVEDLTIVKVHRWMTEVEHLTESGYMSGLCNALAECTYRFDTLSITINNPHIDFMAISRLRADTLRIRAPQITEDSVQEFTNIDWRKNTNSTFLWISEELAKVHEIALRHYNETKGHLVCIGPIRS